MMRGFRISKPISFSILDYLRHYQSLSRTRNHVSPLMLRLFSSSSYNNRSNDVYGSGRPPPPRRRSRDGIGASDRSSSSSRLSGYVDGNEDGGAGETRGRRQGRERRDFDADRNPNYGNANGYRASNRLSSEVNKADRPRSEGNSSYSPFEDDDDGERKSQFFTHQQVKDNKVQDFDGFLERFKLGLDQEKPKPNSDEMDSTKGSGDGGAVAESPTPPPEDADEIFRKMKQTGLIPNAVAMLHGLCSDGLVQEAMKLFGLMRERGTIPEIVIYTAVVEGFCKAQKFDDAKRIFRKMQSNGVVANAFSYGVLVQGLCKGNRLDDAREFCLEMVEAGHSPNLATFTGLVNGFCRERGLEAAQIVISNLRERGFGFDEKAVREYMDKKGPFPPLVWEAILGKKSSQMF